MIPQVISELAVSASPKPDDSEGATNEEVEK